MALEIINIKTDKERYIFGEDSEIKLSFNIESIDKNYTLDSVYINYGIEINIAGIGKIKNIEKLYLSDSVTINYGNDYSFSCIIPIKIPNKKTSEYDLKNIEIKNIIEIIADIKTNFFDCKKEYYPNIELNIDNLDKEINKKFNQIKNENDSNYVKINNGLYLSGVDFINKDFYNYLVKKYKLFKLSIFFTFKNIFITNIIFLLFFFYFYSNFFSDYSFFISISILFSLVYFILINKIIRNTLIKIKKDIINIKFKEKKYIIENFNDKTLKFNDIFENIFVNYNGTYKCNFHCDLVCMLIIKRSNGKSIHEYNINFFSLRLAKYNGNNLTFNNIEIYDGIKDLEKNFIKKGFLKEEGLLNESSIEVIYKIIYDFNSEDLINRSGEIII